MMTERAWVRLASGRRINLLDPQPDAWTDADLAIGLSRTYRWGGHSIWELPLSVAQHSLLVLKLCEQIHRVPLSRAGALQALLHDAAEGLLSFDPISPVKPHLGASFAALNDRLEDAIATRYWFFSHDPQERYRQRASYKYADRIAAASEALHVAGWTHHEIRTVLEIEDRPLTVDHLPRIRGMRPWEPWPAPLAASLFLAKLRELQTPEPSPLSAGDLTQIAERENLLRALAEAFSSLPDSRRSRCQAPPSGCGLKDTLVLAEAHDGSESVEGVVVSGERDDDGAWDLDAPFQIFTADSEFIVCQGYNCHVEIQ